MDDHKLVLLPQPVQHERVNGPIMGMWCETCKKWYYRRNDEWPTVCPAKDKYKESNH